MPVAPVLMPSSASQTTRRGLRQVIPWLLALAVATCTQDNVGPSRGGVGYFSFRPQYQLAGGASLSQFGIVADTVHIRLTRPVDELVLDTAVAFPADSGSLHLALPVELATSPEVLDAVISISAGGVVIFLDSVQVTVKDGAPGSEPPPTVTFDYVGPGSNIGTLSIAPPDTTVVLGDTLFFTALAFDSSAAPVASFYVGWRTSDTTVAKINAGGRLISPNARGTVQVIGTTPTGIADTTTVTFAPVPVIITADSGNAQSGIVGDSLATLFVARVKGADSLGISGIPVRFAAVTAGGTVRDTITLLTDAQGRVRTRAYLGTVAQGYSYTATALGTVLPARTFTATATAAAATAIAIQGGNGQSDTVTQLLPLPLSVRVTDAFGNPVVGANVIFARTLGTGTPALDTIATAAGGIAALPYTLGSAAGLDSIRATLQGTSAFVDFSATAVPGAAAQQILLSGDLQSTTAGTPFALPVTVEVQDGSGNPVLGTMVHFAVTQGGAALAADSAATDVNGQAATAVSSTGAAGAVLVVITSVGAPDTAHLSVTAAAPSAIAIVGGDAQVDTIGRTLGAPLSVHVTDAFTNDVPAAKVYWARTVGTGTVALDSTLTDGTGVAQVGYTLGGTAGTDSITATIAGTSTFVTFSATAISAAPTQIIQGLGGGQTAAAGTVFTDSLTVQVLDANDNPVSGVWVHWLVVSGNGTQSADSTLTDVAGHTGITLTAGTLVGTIQVDASVTGIATPTSFLETITAGAPASFVIASGNGQTGNAGTALPLAPEVRISDAFGNPIAGIGVDFAVTAGGGSIDSTTAITDASGRANAGLWTLGLVAGANQVRATAATFPADTLLFDATGIPAGTSKVWTGAVDNSWLTAGNWSPSGVPTSADNVFIPAAAPAPFLGSTSNTNDLTIESGATLNTGSYVLNIGGNLDVAGNIAGAGFPTMVGTGKTLRGAVSSFLGVTGTITLSGPFSTASQLGISGGTLTVGGHPLTVGGNLSVSGGGQLVMTNAADSVDVAGATTFSTGTSGTGTLTAGVLVLRGSFTQTAGATTNFAPSGTHTTRFLGTGVQTVSFTNPGSAASRFQNVEFGSAGGTTLNSTFTAMGIVTANAGTVTGIGRTANIGGGLVTTYATWQVSTTLWGQDPTVYPDSLPRNVTAFNAWTLTKPFKADSGLLINSTGVLTLNGNTLRVGGSVTQSGRLVMQNAADTLDIGGGLTVNSGLTGAGDLTAGVLTVRGNFSQSAGSTSNYQPSGSHLTRFAASGTQTVNFTSPGSANSRFQNVEFGAPGGVTLATAFTAMGATTVSAGTVSGVGRTVSLGGDLVTSYAAWQVSTTQWGGAPAVYPDSLPRNVSLLAPWTLTKPFKVDSAFTVAAAGILTLNGNALTVGRGFTQGGRLLMQNTADTLDVGGPFTVNSGLTGAGDLTGGIVRLRGGFTQSAGSLSNYQPSGSHVTRFDAAGGQAASFTSAGIGNSRFNHLELADSVQFTSALYAAGNVSLLAGGKAQSANTATLAGDLIDPTALGWRYASTNLAGGPTQAIPAALTTSLTFQDTFLLAQPTTVTGNVAIGGSGVVTLGGHALNVTGSFTQGGHLRMQNAADTLDVGGLFTVNSGASGAGELSAGLVRLHGGFTQAAGSFSNYQASGSHLTRFEAAGGQPASLTSFGPGNSRFQDLEIADSVQFGGNLYVNGAATVLAGGKAQSVNTATLLGALVDTSGLGWRYATTQLSGRFQSIPATLVTNVVLNDSIALAQPTSVAGTFTMQALGYIAFSGHGLGVSGDFTQNSRLVMSSTQDSLDVGGNFLVSSGSDGTGALTAGVIVLHGSFTQTAGSFTNFMADAPHRTRFTGPAARTIDLTTPNQVHFGDLEMDASGPITFNTDVHANGAFTVAGGPVAITAGAQRLLRVQDLAVDGLALDRVRIEMHGSSNAAQFDNVTFTNIAPTLDQLSMELPGLTGDTLKFTNVAFSGTPTTGHYLFVADSVANDAPAVIGLYNSTPLNGALYTAVEGSVGDPATILWTHLDWITQPSDVVELLAIAPAPQVGVFDPSGNVVTGFTGPITLGFLANPGSAVLVGNSVNAVAGVATYDSLTVSLAGVGYQVEAVATGLGQSPGSALFTVTVPIPAGTTTAFNNGGGDNDWFNASNWTFGTPDSLDNVYVLPGQTVTVNAPARANRVTVGTGAGIVLNAPLVVDSSVAAGNTITGGGQLVAQGTGTLTGQVADLYVTGNYVVPTGGHLSAQSIVIDGIGVLDPGLDTITVADSLATLNAGILNMNGATALVDVGGDARFGGGQSTLNNGLLRLRKGLYSYHGFAVTFTPSTNVAFEGTGMQTVVYAVGDSTNALGRVAIAADSVRFVTPVWALGSVSFNGGVTLIDSTLVTLQGADGAPGAEVRGTTLQVGADLTFPGTYAVGTTIFAGPATTITPLAAPFDTVYVSGQALLGGNVAATQFFVIASGQFLLNGHRLDVTGDFGTGQFGQFAMTDPADTVLVGGSFYASGGSTTGLLTDGLLQVAGNFIQGSYVPCCVEIIVTGPMPAADGFNADTGHVTRLVGGVGARLVYFSNPLQPPGSGSVFAGASSKFGTLELVDGLDSLASVVPVAGNAQMSGGAANGVGTLAVVGKLTVGPAVDSLTVASLYSGGGLDYQAAPSSFGVGETFFFGGDSVPVLPYNWLRVGFATMALQGDLVVNQVTLGGQGEGPADSYNGELALNGHTLRTTGNFTMTGFGTVRLDQPADSLDVGGNFNANGGSTSGLVTDGVIVARGAVYVAPNWEDSSFIATGANRFRMAAAGAVDLGIIQGTAPANRFSKFVIEAGTTANFNQFQNGALIATDSLYVNGSLTQASAGQLVKALGPMLESNGADITLDTVELHQTFTPADAGFNVTVVRYAGNGQLIDGSLSYQQLEVTGFATLSGSVSVSQDARIQWGGNLDIAGFGLTATRNVAVLDSATFEMHDPAGVVNADTAFMAGASTEGLLTAGTLRARALVQSSATSDSSYAPSGTHVTRIGTPLGGAEYLIQFASTTGASHLQDLVLDDGGVGGVPTRIAGRVRVQGKMFTATGGSGGVTGTGGATLQVDDSLTVQDPATDFTVDTLVLGGDLLIPASVLASPVTRFIGLQVMPDTQGYQRVEILGDVTMAPGSIGTGDFVIAGAGHFTLGAGQQLIVNGDFTTQVEGTLTMSGVGADLFVAGNATFGGGSAVGQLTNGTLRVVGNFTANPGASSNETFTSQNTSVTFQGSTGAQQVTIDPAMIGNFRGVQITNPFGINITGNMVVTDSVGTYGPIAGDSLSQFGNLHFNTGVPMSLKVLKTSGLFVGLPSAYTVGRTHIVVPNGLPNVAWDTLVIATTGVSAFYPLSAGTVIVAGTSSPFGSGTPGTFDLGAYSGIVTHTISGDLRVEGTGAHLEIAEDTVNVLGNFSTALGGTLGMNGTGALLVSGTSFFGGGSQIGLLTSGELYIQGNLVQTAASSPSSFRTDGTLVEFGTIATHDVSFATPDSSWLPALSSPTGVFSLHVTGRARVAGTLDGYGLQLTGDTLVTDGQLSTGAAGLSATLGRYEGPVFYQFQTVSSWNVATTQFTADGDLPFSDLAFDTLLVSARVGGQLSQLLTADYVEVTGPGNPRHLGASVGGMILDGGDGNTTLNVGGNVVVRGAGAHISSFEGSLIASGDLTVDQDGYLYSAGSFGGGSWAVTGNVTIDGASTVDSLVAGTLSVGGNFTQSATTSTSSFAPDSTFSTSFGSGAHAVTFATPSAAGGGGSYFGSLTTAAVPGVSLVANTDLWVEGTLSTTGYNDPLFQNTAGALRTLTVRDVAIQGITFDHFQLHLAKTGAPAVGAGGMDIVNFTNFLTTEDQFLVDLPGQAAGGFSWSNFTFTQLATDGSDTGHYLVATDIDGGFPFLGVSIGSNQTTSGELGYYVGLNGANVTPFAP